MLQKGAKKNSFVVLQRRQQMHHYCIHVAHINDAVHSQGVTMVVHIIGGTGDVGGGSRGTYSYHYLKSILMITSVGHVITGIGHGV
eukprot:12543950-Ditylum_brightwellii.AAC.1